LEVGSASVERMGQEEVEDPKHMSVSGLSYRNNLVGTGRVISVLLSYLNGVRNKHLTL